MKIKSIDRDASRREFVRESFRYAVLTGLAAVSAILFKRSGKLSGQVCVSQGICRGCVAFAGCGLPQALSAKEFQSRPSRREEGQTSSGERGVHAASPSLRQPTMKRAEARAKEAT